MFSDSSKRFAALVAAVAVMGSPAAADSAQEAAARKSAEQAQRYFDKPIVTEIVAAPHFWPAEDYHQRYFAKHPGHGSCHWVRGWVPAEAASTA